MAQNLAQMREYETIYVLNPELSDGAAKDFMLKMKDLVTREGGKNIQVECWGRRKLAWNRGKQQRGVFVHHRYVAVPGMVREYERNLGNDENVMLRQSILRNAIIDLANVAELPDQLEAPVVRETRRDFSRGQNDFDGDEFGGGGFGRGYDRGRFADQE